MQLIAVSDELTSDKEVTETREFDENIYVDLEHEGNLVTMTIEHAKQRTTLPDVVVEQSSGRLKR